MGSRPLRGRWAPHLCSKLEHGPLYLYLIATINYCYYYYYWYSWIYLQACVICVFIVVVHVSTLSIVCPTSTWHNLFAYWFVVGNCCSAGIGRTGVLIAMETAMCLIEANEPVSLPDIVCQMRDQRAMLIQTAVTSCSDSFICAAQVSLYTFSL